MNEIELQEAYLISKGWEHTIAEADGCDTWHYPYAMRRKWPAWTTRTAFWTQIYWDREEAVSLQKQIDRI